MDPMTGLFLVYLLAVGCCIAVAWGVKEIVFGVGRVVGDWWRLRKQAKADFHHTYRKGER